MIKDSLSQSMLAGGLARTTQRIWKKDDWVKRCEDDDDRTMRWKNMFSTSSLSSPYNLGWDLHTGWQGRLSMWSQLRIIDNWSVITGFCLLFMIEKSNGFDCDSLKMEMSTVAWICWLEAYTAEHLEGFQVKSEEKEKWEKITCTVQHQGKTRKQGATNWK